MDFSTCSGQAGKSTCLQATTPNLPWVSAITMRLSSTRRWLAELAVPREATHLSVSSLPVALEQFTLAVRQCPNREDQALLMKLLNLCESVKDDSLKVISAFNIPHTTIHAPTAGTPNTGAAEAFSPAPTQPLVQNGTRSRLAKL